MTNMINPYMFHDDTIYEIGVDEAGRGPLFGRVYAAAVILPKSNDFDFSKIKDSKKFHSKKKIEEVAKYIKEHALAWHISFEDEKVIDNINILQATQQCMHSAILQCRKKYMKLNSKKEFIDYKYHLLIDGNYFNDLTFINPNTARLEAFPHTTVKGGDDLYSSIAAASILAKVERDKYIEELCAENPDLKENYGIDKNKGYGAKIHIDGIKQYGITKWHRKSFGICKNYTEK